MKKVILTILAALIGCVGIAQCPTSNIELNSQEDVDNFALNYPDCTEFSYDLRIDDTAGDITNLLGLSQLTSVNLLFILGTQINTLEGLHNISVAGDLAIWGNPNLTTLEGLTALEETGGLDLFINSGIQDLSGMDSLQSIGRLSLFGNGNLSDISALDFLTELESLTVGGNDLSDISGLENIQTIERDVSFSNEGLASLDVLSNIQEIGGTLYLAFLSELIDVSAFSQISELEEIYLLECPMLSNLSGLENIQTIAGRLRVGFMPLLTDLSGFANVNSVGGLEIYNNDGITSLSGLESLDTILYNLYLLDNPNLMDISTIGNLSAEGMDEVVVSGNSSLEVCDYPLICEAIFDEEVFDQVALNGGGCYTTPQVTALCLLGTEDNLVSQDVSIAPNPIEENMVLSFPEQMELDQWALYSGLGQLLQVGDETEISMAGYASGIYYLKLNFARGNLHKKLIKL